VYDGDSQHPVRGLGHGRNVAERSEVQLRLTTEILSSSARGQACGLTIEDIGMVLRLLSRHFYRRSLLDLGIDQQRTPHGPVKSAPSRTLSSQGSRYARAHRAAMTASTRKRELDRTTNAMVGSDNQPLQDRIGSGSSDPPHQSSELHRVDSGGGSQKNNGIQKDSFATRVNYPPESSTSRINTRAFPSRHAVGDKIPGFKTSAGRWLRAPCCSVSLFALRRFGR